MESNRRTLLLIATAVVWLIAYVAWTADWMIGPDHHVLERALRRIPLCAFGAGCCWMIRRILDRMATRPIGPRLAAASAMCVAGALTYSGLNALVFYVVSPIWGHTTVGGTLQNAMTIVWVFFAWAALYFAIDGNVEAGNARLRLADAHSASLRARNHALAQQVSPHFLFNALNTVSGLIVEGEPARAERVTLALAGLLRRSLDTDTREFVPLGEEMDAVHRYVEIEENRFEDRLTVAEDVAPALRDIAVPPLILQPLVENAVRHGVARSTGPVRIRIDAALADGKLRIAVHDDARPAPGAPAATGGGIGQPNVRQRLELLYGGLAALRCGACPSGGYLCELAIPVGPHARA